MPPGLGQPGPGGPYDRVAAGRAVPRAEFLERSGIFYDLPNVGPAHDAFLIFEAQAAPHLFFVNELGLVERPDVTRRWLHAVNLTFNLRLRMVADRSAPVRPPSYMPRLDWQAFRFWKRMRPDQRAEFDMLELRASVGHHSNGQQFCTFYRSDAPPGVDPGTPPCPEVDPRAVPNGRVNFRSGDFATNFFVLGGHLARLWLDDDDREARRLSGGLLFEGNPLGFLPGAIGRRQYDIYGPWRLRAEVEAQWHWPGSPGWSWLAGTAAAGASLEVMSRTGSGIPRDREIAEVSHVLDRLGGFGLFARFVTGQDYMNVLFIAGRTTMLQLGLVWEISPRLQYVFEPGGLGR